MIRAFNSFQLVCLFAALPFIINWLRTSADFTGTGAAIVVAIGAYIVLFVAMCVGIFELTEK